MLSQKYRDVFSCPACQGPEGVRDEFKCGGCSSYTCEHLVVLDGGILLCFCCYKDQTRRWPDYCYTMVFEKEPEKS